MSEIKLTKNGLRDEQRKLGQLERYLPTLKLKKAMLQSVVSEAREEIKQIEMRYSEEKKKADHYAKLLTDKLALHPYDLTKVREIKKHYENIAGVEIPFLDEVVFEPIDYPLITAPAWVDSVIDALQALRKILVERDVAVEKLEALERELRAVSIRVNLFEKILIPRSEANIKKIKVFLGDQQLSAIGQVKVAKIKIEEKKAL